LPDARRRRVHATRADDHRQHGNRGDDHDIALRVAAKSENADRAN
jgi:hypothetical protein